MKIYFLRHAEAEEGDDDARRALTRKGRRDAKRAGRFLRDLGLRFDAAYTSPLVRARETAELALSECRLARGAALEETDLLLNDPTPAAFRRWLGTLKDSGSVLLVGHEPSLSARIRALLGIADPERLSLSKGALARVDSEDGKSGSLRFLIGPRQLA